MASRQRICQPMSTGFWESLRLGFLPIDLPPKTGRFSIFSKLERGIHGPLLDSNVVGHIHREGKGIYGARKVDRVKSGRQRSEQDIIAGINEEKINASRDSDDVIFG